MNKLYYWIIGILVVLVAANPSINNFRNYMGTHNEKGDFYELSKTGNYLFFSTYDDGLSQEYIGIFFYFFRKENSAMDQITIKQEDSIKTDSAKTDSTKMDDAAIDTANH